MKKIIAAFILLCCSASVLAKSSNCHRTEKYIPDGWCQPTKADFSDDWLEFKSKLPIPYHVSGYFDDDKKLDEAWVLFDENHKAWGIFIFLMQDKGAYKPYKIEETKFADIKPQFISISASDPGTIETACGKGYWDCGKDEPAKLNLKTNGLVISPYESGGARIVYWEGGKFKDVSLND